MSKPKVLVLGATGQVGKLLGDHLKDDSSLELIVGTRKKEKLDQLSKLYRQAVYIDLDNPQTFAGVLQDIDRLFLLTGYSVSMLVQSKTIIDAAITAGVKHVVHLGVFSRAWNCTAPHFAWHQMIEVYIKNTPLKWTFLHPNCFLQNLTAFSVLTGNELRWYTTKPCGWIALEDVAEAAATILKEGENKHHGKDYWFSTESLDIYQVADVISEVIGTKVIASPRSANLFIPDMGGDPKTIDPYFFSVAETCEQIEDGRMSYIGDVKDDISLLLNRKGLSLRVWAEKHKEELIRLIHETTSTNMKWGKNE
ncbi:NAD(P)H azoreductase [Aquicella siphonis]|uniref:NAD(P)H azoreductase n=1 Tax=Aquicella siphonis TaxID=254247 RepID=A0A5E4PEC4_9COXI|nr:NmrA family NAD(P)-binding protein [Aquicella siphonis]VVC74777.1 NAD(P)H azoreductase [Aquicella siphonis]